MLAKITSTIAICTISLFPIIVSVQSAAALTPQIQPDPATSKLMETISVVGKMNDEFIEVLLLWNEKGADTSVRQWLHHNGLSTTPLKAGLLISGTRAQFEMVFAVDLDHPQTLQDVKVPAELKEHVLSIGVPKRRQPY
jgi:hypothetical protein